MTSIMLYAVVERTSPITVAGAALGLPVPGHIDPGQMHQLPDYPLSTKRWQREAPDVENTKNSHILHHE
jgi:hypothetical protein